MSISNKNTLNYKEDPQMSFNPTNQQMGFGFNNGQPSTPQYRPYLTGEDYALLGKQHDGNLLSLQLDEKTLAKALCPHRDAQNRSTLYVDEDGMHHCSLCGAAFHLRSYTKEELTKINEDMINLMQVCKTVTTDHPVEFYRNFYVVIPLMQKVPDLYEDLSRSVNNFYNSQNNFNAMSPIGYNPDAFFITQNALYNWGQPMMPPQGQMMPPQGQYMNPQGQCMNPQMVYPQGGYNPMAYGNPAAAPAPIPAAPAPAPAPGAMPAPSANPTAGGEVVQTKTMNV